VSGELETPTVFESFDYQDYLARQEVLAPTSNRLNADYSLKRSGQVQFAVAATLLGSVGPSLAFCPTQVETSRRGEKRVEYLFFNIRPHDEASLFVSGSE
jgi:hypothetical protein